MSKLPKKRSKRTPKGIYIDGIGLHQCGLPFESSVGTVSTLSMGDNNHSVLVREDRIDITTRVQTALSLFMQGFLGQSGRLHRVAVGDKELGEGAFVGLTLVDDGRYDRVRLMFTHIRQAAT